MNIADVDADELWAKALEQAKWADDLPPTSVLFEAIIDRDQAKMPSWYLPAAPGALIAGGTILSATGYRPGSHRPCGWRKDDYVNFSRWSVDKRRLLRVKMCGDFWVLLRNEFDETPGPYRQTLICAFSRRPIWTRTPQAAMWLAEHCDPILQAPVAGHWALASK
jgi:hypothetical protein